MADLVGRCIGCRVDFSKEPGGRCGGCGALPAPGDTWDGTTKARTAMTPEELEAIREQVRQEYQGGPDYGTRDKAALLAEVDRLQRIVNGYDRTPAEERASAAEKMAREANAAAIKHWNRADAAEAEAARLKTALEKIEGQLRTLSDAAHEARLTDD